MLSENPPLHTAPQSKSIDLAPPWQIIPAPPHMTQSARRMGFCRAIRLLLYQPNHPLMTSSTHSLHFTTATANPQIKPATATRYLHFCNVTSHSSKERLQRLRATRLNRPLERVNGVIIKTTDVTHECHNQKTHHRTTFWLSFRPKCHLK